jgi:hypothetical protein
MKKVILEVAIDVGTDGEELISTGRYEGEHIPAIGELVDVYVSLENSGEEIQTGKLISIM